MWICITVNFCHLKTPVFQSIRQTIRRIQIHLPTTKHVLFHKQTPTAHIWELYLCSFDYLGFFALVNRLLKPTKGVYKGIWGKF